ncbi:MAG: hypothetical protein IKY87_05930 [Paludibacteraceae bacterium]|nr:hypothetical protein [Paludibacteraceae bacterium]
MFHTTYETEVTATADSCNAVVDDMIYCLQTNPELLSEQYFAGLGMQEDTDKNAFYLEWKESTYVPEKQYSRLVLDVLVNEKPFLRDVVIEAMVTDSLSGDRRDIRVDIHYAGTLIKEAYGLFHIMPTGENTAKIGMDVHVKFGWFFRIFISRKVYSETIDWRLVRFVENLRLRSEGIVVDDAYWEAVATQP